MSLVIELKVGFVGIHNWCQFCDSTSKLKVVRDVRSVMDGFVMGRFVMDKFVTDRQMESMSIVPHWGDG